MVEPGFDKLVSTSGKSHMDDINGFITEVLE
jgi:hypothetical protein